MAALILIVDDDPIQRRLLEAMIRRFGYEAETAESGEGALARLQVADRPPIDLLILDLVMPDLDGLARAEAESLLAQPGASAKRALLADVEVLIEGWTPVPRLVVVGAAVVRQNLVIEVLDAQRQPRDAHLAQGLELVLLEGARLALEGHLRGAFPGHEFLQPRHQAT